MPYQAVEYLEFYFSHSLEKVLTRTTRITDETATLTDYILTEPIWHYRFWFLWSQLDVLQRKTSLPKSKKQYKILVLSMKKKLYAKNFIKSKKNPPLLHYLTYICVSDTYSSFMKRFAEAINFIALAKP